MARKSTDTVAITLRIREDLRRRLEREAKKKDTSLNSEMEARLENSFELTNTASLIRVLVGGGFHSELLGAIARVLDGNWKEYPEKSLATQVRREAAYVALVYLFTNLLSAPEHPLDPASVPIHGGECSAAQMEGIVMAQNVLNKVEHINLLLEPSDLQRKHGLIPTDADLLAPGLLKFPKRKKGKTERTKDK